jgi:PilZ domain
MPWRVRVDRWVMARLSPSQATARLFQTSRQPLEVDSGASLIVHATSVHGTQVVGTAPHLDVAAGMIMVGRVVADDERPWEISFRVESAEFFTHQLARVELRAIRVRLDKTRRGSVRMATGGVAALTAVNCQNVVDNDRVEGTVTDLSHTGVGFSTDRLLRRGDRLAFRGRFFNQEIRAELRVTSVRDGASGGRLTVGARFITIDREDQAKIDRLLSGAASPRPPHLNLSELLVHPTEVPPGHSGWRKLFKCA